MSVFMYCCFSLLLSRERQSMRIQAVRARKGTIMDDWLVVLGKSGWEWLHELLLVTILVFLSMFFSISNPHHG